METKLRLILKRIHWSLALKAAILAAGWLVLPGWAFLILSVYLYFVPIFDPWKLFLPFLVFLFLAFTGPPNPGFAFILGSLFYVILGIKDLILIDRRSAYDIMTLISLFLLDIWFFSNFGDSVSLGGIFLVFFLGVVSCLLYKGSLAYSTPGRPRAEKERIGVVMGLTWLIISQISLAVLFLPLNFLYQSALVFFLTAIIFGLVSAHLNGTVTRERILMNFSAVFVFLVVAMGSVQWGL